MHFRQDKSGRKLLLPRKSKWNGGKMLNGCLPDYFKGVLSTWPGHTLYYVGIHYTDPCCTHINCTDQRVANLMRTYKHYTDPWFRNPWTSHDFYYFFTGFQSLIRLVCKRAVRIEAASSGVIRISGCNAVKASLSLRPAPFLHKRWSFRYPGHPVAFAVVPTLCSTVLSLATCH